MSWPEKATEERRSLIRAAVEVMRGTTVADGDVGPPPSEWYQPLASVPTLLAHFDAGHNTVHMINSEFRAQPSPAVDVGPQGARQAAAQFLKDLGSRGLIDPSGFSLDTAEVSYLRSGYGEVGGTTISWVSEYRYRMLRRLNGIPIANAGVVLGIHCSGERSSLRFGGVEVESIRNGTVDTPTSGGYTYTPVVQAEDADARFQVLAPGARVVRSGLMYVMPPTAVGTVAVEPLNVYFFSRPVAGDNGNMVVPGIETVGFSTRDLVAAPVDFTFRGDADSGVEPVPGSRGQGSK
jgi:hypothetical protein